jgi:hypothetical protein
MVRVAWLGNKGNCVGQVTLDAADLGGGMSPIIIGPMRKTIERLRRMERDLSEEHGAFSLFGAARPISDEGPDKWLLIAAAPWLSQLGLEGRTYFYRKMSEYLAPNGYLPISAHILDCDNPELETIHEALDLEHGLVETFNFDLFNQTFLHAYIITSKRAGAATGRGAN